MWAHSERGLGGLFQIHTLEVLTEEENDVVAGLIRAVPVFEPATPAEAHELMQRTRHTCRICSCDDFNPCSEGCFWVEPDLCSVCAMKETALSNLVEPAPAEHCEDTHVKES